ncbi:helix-turn-helix domain-containing protein [Paraliobacillus ryukyuensis]|uniref:helix-turn-helix domain-containing protein n=1 Tax=Paraliobacillus ryukyuensis TaxID=200904 RepID=UPI0009A73171|nr:helix-turn-helix transcriptional regulator [Paraliobacillus ryukyuensis]
MNDIGKRLKELRIENNLYQKDIAQILEITVRQLQKYEKNQSDLPISKAIKLANYFNVTLDYLVGRSNDK